MTRLEYHLFFERVLSLGDFKFLGQKYTLKLIIFTDPQQKGDFEDSNQQEDRFLIMKGIYYPLLKSSFQLKTQSFFSKSNPGNPIGIL